MKKYETSEIEVQRIEVEDVITTSDTLNDENLGEW
jgi:hypothetical protein